MPDYIQYPNKKKKAPEAYLHLNELLSMREEVNWRVKMSYTSYAAFFTLFGFGATLFSKDLVELDGHQLYFIYNGISILISTFVGVMNANHIIEKRLELYMLELQRIMFKIEKYPHHYWLSFLYGYKDYKNSTWLSTIAKYLRASVGFFIYLIPILASGLLLFYSCRQLFCGCTIGQIFGIISWLIWLLAFGSLILLVINMSSLSNKHEKFYNTNVIAYKNKLKLKETKD